MLRHDALEAHLASVLEQPPLERSSEAPAETTLGEMRAMGIRYQSRLYGAVSALKCRLWNDGGLPSFLSRNDRMADEDSMSMRKMRNEEDPRETPLDDPRQKTDWPNTKQTDRPWKGKVEKDQQNRDSNIDLEKWQDSNTH